jgi:uncharacterized caspase-like protein
VLGSATSDDIVIVSFSSHGTPDHRLVVHDTTLSSLVDTTIDMAELAQAFKTSKAKVILCILDCCFSGGAPARVLDDAPVPRNPTIPIESIAGAGRILIAASGINEPALESGQHGLLSLALIEALQAGTATVSIPTIMDQVMQRVRTEALRKGYQQNPRCLAPLTVVSSSARFAAGRTFSLPSRSRKDCASPIGLMSLLVLDCRKNC